MSTIIKPWGAETLLEVNEQYVVKFLKMKKGHQCSLQYHEKKKETIYVLSGRIRIIVDKYTYNLERGASLTISPGSVHRMYGTTDCEYLECSTTELDDVVRVEDDYNRV